MRVIPRARRLTGTLPRRLRWTRARVPTRRRVPRLHRPEGHMLARPSARTSLAHLGALLAVVAVVWSAGAIFQTVYAGRIYPHITIDHVPVGGMTRADALAALRDTETARIHAPIYVEAGGQSWQVTPAQFGARYDIASAVDRAVALAHTGPPVVGGWTEAQTIANGANIPLSGTHDAAAVARFLAGVTAAVHIGPRGAVVGVRGNDVAILREPIPGQRLDVAGASAALGAVVNTHDATVVTLPLQQVDSALGHDQAEAALDRAHALLAAPITFQWTAGNSQSWQLPPRGILRLLTFTPHCTAHGCRFDLGINTRKLGEALDRGGVASSIDRDPTPASYELYLPDSASTAPSVRVLPDSIGVTIDVANTANQVLEQGGVPPGNGRTIFIPTLPVYPSFTTQKALALNFDSNVGQSVLPAPGLDWARLDNLALAGAAISNTILGPGQTFSLSRIAGPFSAGRGYIMGQNVRGPGDASGVAGGVDLFASDVLSAAYDAGLPIVRRAHYPYINAFTLPGLDATVSYGPHGPDRSADLVFRNTTDHPILMMTSTATPGAVYIFNSHGYAPSHGRGVYSSVVGPTDITLNPDGSADTVLPRTLTVAGLVRHDRLSSHYTPIDP